MIYVVQSIWEKGCTELYEHIQQKLWRAGKGKNLAKKKYFSFNTYGQSHGGDKGGLVSSCWINRTLKGNWNSITREFTLGVGSRYDFHLNFSFIFF